MRDTDAHAASLFYVQIVLSARYSCDVSCMGFKCGMYVQHILHSLACWHNVPAYLADTGSTAGML